MRLEGWSSSAYGQGESPDRCYTRLIVASAEWFRHLYALLGRTWELLLVGLGTRTLGLLVFSGAVPVITLLISFFVNVAHRRRGVDPLVSSALKDSIWPTLYSIAAVVIVLGVLFAVYATRIIYKDHQTLVAAVTTLRGERDTARAEAEERKHTLRFNDGAFYNMTHLISVFMAFRRAIGPDAKCMWLITSPEDNPLVGVVMTLAVVGSNCPNGNLQNIGIKPEHVEEENRKGMVAGKIVIHALPDTKGANELVDNLGNLIQVQRDYTLPATPPGENYIWLQFGPGVKLNSQLR